MKHLFVFVIIFCLCACSDKEPIENPTPTIPPYGNIEVTLLNCTDGQSCQVTEPIGQKQINIYYLVDDYAQQKAPNRTAFTDSEGKALFTRLDSFDNYIQITFDTFDVFTLERAPRNTTSFKEIRVVD